MAHALEDVTYQVKLSADQDLLLTRLIHYAKLPGDRNAVLSVLVGDVLQRFNAHLTTLVKEVIDEPCGPSSSAPADSVSHL